MYLHGYLYLGILNSIHFSFSHVYMYVYTCVYIYIYLTHSCRYLAIFVYTIYVSSILMYRNLCIDIPAPYRLGGFGSQELAIPGLQRFDAACGIRQPSRSTLLNSFIPLTFILFWRAWGGGKHSGLFRGLVSKRLRFRS